MFFKFSLFKAVFFQSIAICALFFICGVGLNAQTINIDKGDVTGLSLPRFVSVKSNKVNVRRGPSSKYQIDWVYTRSGIPLKVTAEYDVWRRVEDFQGEGGWIHSRLLSGKRFIIFLNKRNILKRKPSKNSVAIAIIEKGVIAKFIREAEGWCEISIDGYSGWASNNSVWGVSNNLQLKR